MIMLLINRRILNLHYVNDHVHVNLLEVRLWKSSYHRKSIRVNDCDSFCLSPYLERYPWPWPQEWYWLRELGVSDYQIHFFARLVLVHPPLLLPQYRRSKRPQFSWLQGNDLTPYISQYFRDSAKNNRKIQAVNFFEFYTNDHLRIAPFWSHEQESVLKNCTAISYHPNSMKRMLHFNTSTQ